MLTNAKVSSIVDAKNEFWLLKLDDQSSKLTTFGTVWGRFKWRRLPFEVSPGSEIFQARIYEALESLMGVACIADDILVFRSDDNLEVAQRDHERNLIALLDRCREQDIRLNQDKLQLNRSTTTFMGHELTANGLRQLLRRSKLFDRYRLRRTEQVFYDSWAWLRILQSFVLTVARQRQN